MRMAMSIAAIATGVLFYAVAQRMASTKEVFPIFLLAAAYRDKLTHIPIRGVIWRIRGQMEARRVSGIYWRALG